MKFLPRKKIKKKYTQKGHLRVHICSLNVQAYLIQEKCSASIKAILSMITLSEFGCECGQNLDILS